MFNPRHFDEQQYQKQIASVRRTVAKMEATNHFQLEQAKALRDKFEENAPLVRQWCKLPDGPERLKLEFQLNVEMQTIWETLIELAVTDTLHTISGKKLKVKRVL